MISMVIVALLLIAALFYIALVIIIPEEFGNDSSRYLVYLISASLRLSSGFVGCYLGHRIMSSVAKEGSTPFTIENAKKMRQISALTILTIVCVLGAEILMIAILNITDYTPSFSLVMLLMALLTYAFSLLFEYGTALQTESDEFI